MTAQEIYDKVIAEGGSPRLAEMLALRSPPMALTDRELFDGVGTLDKQFDGATDQLEKTVAAARKHGYSPGVNDFYNPMIARFIGDPEGFIPPTGGRNHMRRVMEKRQANMSGAVEVKAPMYREPTPDIPLSEAVVSEKMAELLSKDSKAKAASKKELRQEIIKKHAKP